MPKPQVFHEMAAQVNGHSNGTKITLYTNHDCPYAHRARIALIELGLPFEDVIIDLDTPREPWYLKINPVSLVMRHLLNMAPHTFLSEDLSPP